MGKGVFLGVGDKARKVKKMFTGVDDVARKVKKAWIGVGGVARLVFGGGKIVYYGPAPQTADGHWRGSAATIGDHAIFKFGMYGNSTDFYDKQLVHTSTTGSDHFEKSTAYVDGFALFAGGLDDDFDVRHEAEAYNANLVKNTLSNLSFGGIQAGASVGGYAIFAGGKDSQYRATAMVEAFSSNLVRISLTPLGVARQALSGASNEKYALFAGGLDDGYYDLSAVDAYNASLVRSTPSPLSTPRVSAMGGRVKKHAIFAGGGSNWSYTRSDVVDAYDENLIRRTLAPLSVARGWGGSATLGEFVIFAGGGDVEETTSVTDIYDDSLTWSAGPSLAYEGAPVSGTTLGNFALFGPINNEREIDVFLYQE